MLVDFWFSRCSVAKIQSTIIRKYVMSENVVPGPGGYWIAEISPQAQDSHLPSTYQANSPRTKGWFDRRGVFG